jgi:hypothetical protein
MSTTTVTVEIVRYEEDATFFVDSAKFDGNDRRDEAQKWARTALANHRAMSTFPDDLYAYFSEDMRGWFGEPNESLAYAYLFHPDEPITWEDEP